MKNESFEDTKGQFQCPVSLEEESYAEVDVRNKYAKQVGGDEEDDDD